MRLAPPSHRAVRVVLAALLVGAACSNPTESSRPAYEARPGILPADGPGTIGSVVVADSVSVGSPLAVTVTTQGGGCTRRGRTEVRAASALVAEVLPYDSVPSPDSRGYVCTADIRGLEHAAVVQFAVRGRATVRVRGRSGGPAGADREVVVERGVTVY
jgi:hypothetical protein